MKFISTVTLHSPVLQQWTRTSARSGGVSYNEDDHQDAWIGCDNEDTCGRWFHYWCAGFDRKPRTRKKFICSYCLNKDK